MENENKINYFNYIELTEKEAFEALPRMLKKYLIYNKFTRQTQLYKQELEEQILYLSCKFNINILDFIAIIDCNYEEYLGTDLINKYTEMEIIKCH